MSDAKRVKFDFEVDFSNGGGIQGQDFRLDIAGDTISDATLADYIVQDMRLLMVGEVRILNKEIISEAHKRTVEKAAWIETLRTFPAQLEAMLANLTDDQIYSHAPHDPWSVAQIVHHCADSHMNSFVRLKLVLTEERPLLKNYDQDAWSVMADETTLPVAPSLAILRGLHQRWVTVFENIADDEWERVGIHTTDGTMSVTDLLRNYAAHCEAHLEQMERVVAAV
ncbi:MAG: DinB family protein [Chloroflexota bacterium]